MTFERLHEGIKDGCDCTSYGSEPKATHVFHRRGENDPALPEDFYSLFEKGLSVSGTTCKEHCHHRGVSVNQIKIDLAKKKQQLKEAGQFSPSRKPQKYAYFIRLRANAGLVWYQEGKDHCELFKSDDFSLEESLEFVDVFDTSIP